MLQGQRGCHSPWVLLLPEWHGVKVGSPGSWEWGGSEVLKYPLRQWGQETAGRTPGLEFGDWEMVALEGLWLCSAALWQGTWLVPGGERRWG